MDASQSLAGAPFNECNCCHFSWPDRRRFLEDGTLHVIGYQADFRDPEHGLILFNHAPCKSTLAVRAGEFVDLYTGPRYSERRTDTPECPGYCSDETQLARCHVRCEFAFVREVLHIVRGWPKAAEPPPGAGTACRSTPREVACPASPAGVEGNGRSLAAAPADRDVTRF